MTQRQLDANLYDELDARGLVKQVTSERLRDLLMRESICLYIGFDPTSDSLHVGSLLQIITLMRFQRAGHRPIAVVGGATGMIGDPSGKSTERSFLENEKLQFNLRGIERTLKRFLKFDGENPARVVNNADWFKDLSFLAFLRDVGKHFTINHMIAKESVRARLEDREHGISYTEFSYMLLQAYDFYHLYRSEFKCRLQVGGSDQWGNITAGAELIRRKHHADLKAHHDDAALSAEENELAFSTHHEAYGLTSPLIMKSDGTKFGKTEGGSVWLDAEKTSPYQFYQFWVQTQDADVIPFLKYFTFLTLSEIAELERALQSAPEKREAQRVLAKEMTRLVHGEEALKRAIQATEALFSEEIRSLDAKTIQELFSGAPRLEIPRSRLQEGQADIVSLLAESGLTSSKGASRKEIQGGGVYLNNVRITDPNLKLTESHLIAGRYFLLRRGKKTYHLIEVT